MRLRPFCTPALVPLPLGDLAIRALELPRFLGPSATKGRKSGSQSVGNPRESGTAREKNGIRPAWASLASSAQRPQRPAPVAANHKDSGQRKSAKLAIEGRLAH